MSFAATLLLEFVAQVPRVRAVDRHSEQHLHVRGGPLCYVVYRLVCNGLLSNASGAKDIAGQGHRIPLGQPNKGVGLESPIEP